MGYDVKTALETGKTVLGIEFGSTRIKAVKTLAALANDLDRYTCRQNIHIHKIK